MSIFNRRDDKQTSTAPAAETGAPGGQPEQVATLTPPQGPAATATRTPAAPGVVPPPAAPVYSTRPPERPHADDTDSAMAERVRAANEARRRAQESVQGRLEVAVERTRTTAPAASAALRRRPAPPAAPAPPRTFRRHAHQAFDPSRAAQTGLLHLAWSWQQAGAPIRAIHAYMQLLARYPGTPAAAAAVADLVELSDKLATTGQFHIALGIYDQLEELLACE